MPWHLAEFLLKGIYLGLLVALALRARTWQDVAVAGLCLIAGLVISLGTVAVRKVREGYHVKGRLLGFILFLLLENPGRVYLGVIAGLALGIALTPIVATDEPENSVWLLLIPVACGALLGMLFRLFRQVRQSKVRLWLGLGFAAVLMASAAAVFLVDPNLLQAKQQFTLGCVLLLGIPGFYLLTFASLIEESEVEIAAMCGALGAGLWLMLSGLSPLFSLILLLPLGLYYLYTKRILPGLRVFKHALRGLSFAQVGEYRLALASLNRALRLNPRHVLAREQLWYVHRQLDFAQLKNDAETLALVNFDLCLERAEALLLMDKPQPPQLDEAERLLELIADQRPAYEPSCAYWRAVASLHRRKYDEAARDLESILGLAEVRKDPVSDEMPFRAWQLALILHPEMKLRVGTPMLARPGKRLEAIAVVERRLAGLGGDNETNRALAPTNAIARQPRHVVVEKQEYNDAWDLKRLLYSELTEGDYQPGNGDFDHAYVQQLGLALIDNPERWRRGCEFLRIAAQEIPLQAPSIYIQIGKVHAAHDEPAEQWCYFNLALQAGRKAGVANLTEEDRQNLFTATKLLGEQAMAENNIDAALDAFKFYSQNERSGLETYRTLAELFERKGDVWMALHCTQHALSYDGNDKDLIARKDRYYYSIAPGDVKDRWESVRLWFDEGYCKSKAGWLLERYAGDLDLLDWAGHLAELAMAAQPGSLTARLLRARVLRVRGQIPESTVLLEEIRQNRPEKFVSEDEEQSWYLAHRLLGDTYLDDKPDQAVLCLQEFRKSDRSGADTIYKMGRAYENLGDFARASRCYENVTAFEKHPLYYEAREALERVKRHPVS